MNAQNTMKQDQLSFGITFEDLYTRDGLIKVDAALCHFLNDHDPALLADFLEARTTPPQGVPLSECLLKFAPYVEEFLITLFGVEEKVDDLKTQFKALSPLFPCKRTFVQRRVAAKYKEGDPINHQPKVWDDLAFATAVMGWLEDEEAHQEDLEKAAEYAKWALFSKEGKAAHKGGVLFKLPQKTTSSSLINVDHITPRLRDGFALTDPGTDVAFALDQANYCIWCHVREKDSCSKGIQNKETASVAKNDLGVTLAGCPLEEKISEMNWAKAHGYTLGALSIAVVDNPMIVATGHRICNDCMKACIYQKQEPVNIPHVETQIVEDVLSLPWGFEIYSLLTRWNPLNFARPLPLSPSNRQILVVGMGPAGFTLAHYLLRDGHSVVAIDGAKIEPLDVPFTPIIQTSDLYERLDDRIMAGFGGVAEYGITVRWNKNYLKVIRLLLERNSQFQLYGGVRMGGTLTLEQAFEGGIDHIALCAGAGKPRMVPMKNALAKGVRQASDFLMSLQLTGAAKEDSIANLELRLPVVVIGGGLTAIDTATEAMAYYPVQVEKFLKRYEYLVHFYGEESVRASWTDEDHQVADVFITHARAYRQERDLAKEEGRAPNLQALTQKFGGVTVAYRKYLLNAPAYRLNHEEVEKALEEGIWFEENLTPVAVEVDSWGHVKALECDTRVLPAQSILVAAGTQPNTVLAQEDGRLSLDGLYFEALQGAGEPPIFMHQRQDGRRVSFFGDLHPQFSGNVVKAMASAKQGYPLITDHLKTLPLGSKTFDFQSDLKAEVYAVNRLTPTIVEVVLRAPAAARAFKPGQFYRLQNYETYAPYVQGTRLAMEGLAMTGAWVDKDKGLIATIVLEMGGSSSLCHLLRPGEPVILMGPTGTPTEIPTGENVLLVGGGLGNAVLFSIGQALREKGSHVTYYAAFRKNEDRFHEDHLRRAADQLVWCVEENPGPSKEQVFHGNVLEALKAHGDFTSIDRIITIGSDRMMAAVAQYIKSHGHLFKPTVKTLASINAPMQCMMKEICAQCLQKHVDSKTGEEVVVFTCTNQDQNMLTVDYTSLRDRLSQNRLSEKITALWINECLAYLEKEKKTA